MNRAILLEDSPHTLQRPGDLRLVAAVLPLRLALAPWCVLLVCMVATVTVITVKLA